MVDRLIRTDETGTTSVFQPGPENIFSEGGFLKEPGLIENIAQTAALRAGYEAKQSGEKVKAGIIGAVKNFKVHQLPADTDQLTTTVVVMNNFWNVTIVKGQTLVGDRIVAEAELSIFTPEEQAE